MAMSASFADELRIPPPPRTPRELRPMPMRFEPRFPARRAWLEVPVAALAGFGAAALCAAVLGL